MSRITRRDLAGTIATRIDPNNTQANPIVGLIEEAQRALAHETINRPGFDDPLVIPKKAAAMRTLVLQSAKVPMLDGKGQLTSPPVANMAAKTIPASTAIAEGSRVAQAGASLVFLPDHFDPKPAGQNKGMVFVENFPKAFVNVDASPFAAIADDADVPLSDRPISVGAISLDGLRQFSVSHKVNRKEQVTRGAEQVADEILAGIVAGISRAVDTVFCEAVLAGTPAAFSLALAAAKGAKVESLRALVGTTGTGGTWRGDGRFVVADGIPAELTAATASTIVGWFERGAVVLGPDLSILAERLNVNGDLTLTAWFSLAAVVPDTDSFWSVSA